jgi:hypothetical protein
LGFRGYWFVCEMMVLNFGVFKFYLVEGLS